MNGGEPNGQLDEQSRQEVVEAYWQEVEADRADDETQPEPGHGHSDDHEITEGQSLGRRGHGGGTQAGELNIQTIPEEAKERAAREYTAGRESMEVVAQRHGMSRYTLSHYLRKRRDAAPPDELTALRRVLEVLEGQPTEVCERILRYAASHKGVTQ